MNPIEFNKNVTFLIKTFNRPFHLYRLLNSISDYYPNAKKIIVNDGDIHIDLTKYPNVSLHTLPFNQGISYGRNFLCQLANTKYIMLLDDDFIITKNSNLHKLFELIETTDYDMIAGSVYDKENGKRKLEGTILFKENELHILPINSDNEIIKCDFIPNFFIAKLSSLKKISWDNHLKINEHIDFFIRAKGKLNIACYKKPYILHDKMPINENYVAYRNLTEQYNKYFANKYDVHTIYIFDSCIKLI